MPGFVVSGLIFTAGGSAVAVAEDAASGLYDRLRSLPIPGVAVLAGRALADAALMCFVALVTLLVGVAVGFRFGGGAAGALAAIGLVAVCSLAFAWVFVWLGLVSGSAQAAQGLGILGVPFSFLSSAFVPVDSMPAVLEAFADHQPLTFMVDAVRGLLLGDAATATFEHGLSYYVDRLAAVVARARAGLRAARAARLPPRIIEPVRDAVVIGAGHNGLVAAAYLARGGLDVEVLERRDVVGGACVTEELWPGVRASPGAYTLSLLRRRIMDDLDLAGHGLRVEVHEPYLFAPQPDGDDRKVVTWSSRERTHAQLRRDWSPADADGYAAWAGRWEAAAARARPLLLQPPDRERWLAAVGPEILDGCDRRRPRRHPLGGRARALRAAGADRHAGRTAGPGHRLRRLLPRPRRGDRAARAPGASPQGGMGAVTQALRAAAAGRGRPRAHRGAGAARAARRARRARRAASCSRTARS